MDSTAWRVASAAATVLLLAAVSAQPVAGRDPAALRSPDWGVYAPAASLRAAPPPPPSLSSLANLYTIINGRSAAALPAPSYLNAFHHNLLDLRPYYLPKPYEAAKESPLKIYQPALEPPLTYQRLDHYGSYFPPRAGGGLQAQPYQFPTNRPPPAVTTTTTEAATSSEEVTTSPPPTPAPPTEGDKNKPTTLILKPYAKAVAGINGTAVATPVGHAIYHKGQSVDVLFDPRAVAVAGPGGHARAHADLIVSYVEEEKKKKK